MKKRVTCGVVVWNRTRTLLLLGRPPFQHNLDLFKGQCEPGETHVEAAIREAKEEANLDLTPEQLHPLGLFYYNKQKDICLFEVVLDTDDFSEYDLKCSTFFEFAGKEWPEMCSYVVVDRIDFLSRLNKSMFTVFTRNELL